MAAVVLGIAALIAPIPYFQGTIAQFIPFILFPLIPLLALAIVAGQHWNVVQCMPIIGTARLILSPYLITKNI